MRVLGVDFGTSNTAAMLRLPDGRTRPLLFDGAPLMPSAVYLTPEGQMLVGRDAERNARVDPGRFEPNPKRRVDDGVVLLGEAALPVPQVFAAVLRQVGTEAHRQLGAPPEQIRLTHPARWGEQRRRLLAEACRLAGLGNPQLIAEPVAAASYFTAVLRSAVPVGRSLAIYDLGGGTFDATVVRRTPTGFAVLAEEGLADVGGLDFDHAIVELLGQTYAASHPQQWASLVNPSDGNERRYRRMLYEDVRAAKEMLSRTTSADIHLPTLEVDAHLTREEFEGLVRPQLERTVVCLNRCLVSTGIPARDLVGIFLVGGSSRIPLAAHLIHTELQIAPTTLEQPETVVVEGALSIGAPAPPPGAAHPGHSGVPRPFSPRPPQMAPQGRPFPPAGQPAGRQPWQGPPAGTGPGGRPPVQMPPGPARQPAPMGQAPMGQAPMGQGAPRPPGMVSGGTGPGGMPPRAPGMVPGGTGPGGMPAAPVSATSTSMGGAAGPVTGGTNPVSGAPNPAAGAPNQVSGPPISPAQPAPGPTRPAPLPPRMVPPAGPLPPPRQAPLAVPVARPMPAPMPPTRPAPMPAPMAAPMPPPMSPSMAAPMPMRQPPQPQRRAWYQEPVKIGTVVALVLLAALLVVLIVVATG
jgi:molecular chaperone DnaK